ncbi:GMP synthase-like protein [Daphnia magna]|uniref:GMP synthase-like protein n=1 Tax=Daphnia magna TaxID=35525 RepID=A0A164ZWX1_9CRUS|nr:GMP synthase-like protein [Daphnia magna]
MFIKHCLRAYVSIFYDSSPPTQMLWTFFCLDRCTRAPLIETQVLIRLMVDYANGRTVLSQLICWHATAYSHCRCLGGRQDVEAVLTVPGIFRVLYDLTAKPPWTREWE